MEIPTNPAYYGSMWILLHMKSARAKTLQAKLSLIEDIIMLSEIFPCEKCRNHIKEYLQQHSFEKYMNLLENGEDIGMFKWMWEFHNAVNLRIGKPFVTFQNALNMYSSKLISNTQCYNCNVSNNKINNNTNNKINNKTNNKMNKSMSKSNSEDSFEYKGEKEKTNKKTHEDRLRIVDHFFSK